MANRFRGEATVTIDGKTYTLLMDFHALMLAQDALTKGDVVPSIDEMGTSSTLGPWRHQSRGGAP